MPSTPQSHKKWLRVIPIFLKRNDQEQHLEATEYLVDKSEHRPPVALIL